MVLAIRPDSRATLRKETPRSLGGATAAVGGEAAPWERNAGIHVFGSARASTFSSGSTNAERLSDWRNTRRVVGKRTDTFPCEPRARIRRSFIVRPTRQCKHTTQRGPPQCRSRRKRQFIFKDNSNGATETTGCVHGGSSDYGNRGNGWLGPASTRNTTRARAIARGALVGIFAGYWNAYGTAW